MKKKKKQSLLWELRSNQSKTKSYLFGTMHVKDYRAFIYQDIITEYIDTCKIFATEFDLREREQLQEPSIGKLPKGSSLESLLGKNKFIRLRKIVKKSFSIDLRDFNETLPFFIINLLTEQILISTNSIPLDTFLWQYAENIQRDLRGVETFKEQLVTLGKIPLEYQLKGLRDIGANPQKFRKQINKLISMYVNNDVIGLYKKSKKSLGKQKQLLLHDRNVIMTNRINMLMNEKSSFIAIGAAHLSGKQGVISLLKKQDIKIKPVLLDLT